MGRSKFKTVPGRFWSKVEITDGCWLWTGAISKKWGYGHFALDGYKPKLAHRVAWELHNGPIPEGLCVLHHCDTPACVRPDHLFLGTIADNNQDKARKGRAGTCRGITHRWCRLTLEEADEIAALHAVGDITIAQLARNYGVGRGLVSRIVKGIRFRTPKRRLDVYLSRAV